VLAALTDIVEKRIILRHAKKTIDIYGENNSENNVEMKENTSGEVEESQENTYYNCIAPIEIVVTVVGAGRGPLIAAVLSAAASCTYDNLLLLKYKISLKVRIIAVEKNQNAIITLRNRIHTERWSNVTLIAMDMRNWSPKSEDLCDIMVSELLGSFGDNELSPECLDGAQKCMKNDG
jgi:hypothetical protein